MSNVFELVQPWREVRSWELLGYDDPEQYIEVLRKYIKECRAILKDEGWEDAELWAELHKRGAD